MKTMITRTMMPRHRVNAAAKNLTGKKNNMMMNQRAHVITPHGKVMSGRKGRKG